MANPRPIGNRRLGLATLRLELIKTRLYYYAFVVTNRVSHTHSLCESQCFRTDGDTISRGTVETAKATDP